MLENEERVQEKDGLSEHSENWTNSKKEGTEYMKEKLIKRDESTEFLEKNNENKPIIKYKATSKIPNYFELDIGTLGPHDLANLVNYVIFNLENFSQQTSRVNSINDYIKLCLIDDNLKISDKNIKKAFSRVRPFGRFYRAGSNPVFILDGAHNIPAAQALRKNILLTFKDKEVIYITGAFKDKEYVETIKTAAVNSKTVFTVTAPGDRGLDAHILSGRLQEAGLLSVPKDSVKEAVGAACLLAEKENMPIIAFGSLSWLKEAKKQYDNRKKGFR